MFVQQWSKNLINMININQELLVMIKNMMGLTLINFDQHCEKIDAVWLTCIAQWSWECDDLISLMTWCRYIYYNDKHFPRKFSYPELCTEVRNTSVVHKLSERPLLYNWFFGFFQMFLWVSAIFPRLRKWKRKIFGL